MSMTTEEKLTERPQSGRSSSSDLFEQTVERVKNRDMLETIHWKHWSVEYPDEETTVLIQLDDGEVQPGYLTHNDNDEKVWRLEYWPQQIRDKTDRNVIAWAEWPAGPINVPLSSNVKAQGMADREANPKPKETQK